MSVGRHCRKCRLDLTDVVRIRCAQCADLELCVECFAEGVELDEHRSDHPYSVIDLLDFPVLDENWSAEEELKLLEGIDLFGMGNWADIASHIMTKNLDETRDHYIQYYINSSNFPIPEDTGRTFDVPQREKLRERIQVQKENWKPTKTVPTTSKPLTSQPANHEVAGFMPLRKEFETELENEAEAVISTLSFQDDDPPEERELKFKLLEIYNWKLERRYERRSFILDRGFVNYRQHQALDRKRSKEEKDLLISHRPFARFQTSQDFDLFMEGIINEHKIRTRIVQLQEYRRMGITSFAALDTHEGDRRRREAEAARKQKETQTQFYFDRGLPVRRTGRERDEVIAVKSNQKKTDLSGAEGVQLLSPKEYDFCSTTHILPQAYLLMKERMTVASAEKGSLSRSEACQVTQGDPGKIEKAYDFLCSLGWVSPPPPAPPSQAS